MSSSRILRAIWRLAVSAGAAGLLLAICLRIPHVDHATVALLTVLLILALATVWGWVEAMMAALVGSLGTTYFFLPPRGFSIARPEHWVVLATFLVTAAIAGRLASESKQRERRAADDLAQMRKLHRLVNGLLGASSSAEALAAGLADQIVEIFDASGVAIYLKSSGAIFRSGPSAAAIDELALIEVATSAEAEPLAGVAFSLGPIRGGGESIGSLGIAGGGLSDSLFSAIAGRIGLGLARLYAIRKSNEAEIARRADELKSATLDAMAHEIRNPLNSIKLAVTTLLSGSLGSPAGRRQMLEIIDEEVSRMDGAIDQAVKLARLEADEFPLRKEPLSVASLIPAAIEGLGLRAGTRAVHVCVPDSLPPAECDRDMMLRVVRELLNNALKYSPEHTPLSITAGCADRTVVLDVIDRGPGIPEPERERIFEKYYRGRSAGPRKPGTGLGLASARTIVRAHGGDIWVTEPAGGGAAFHVSLPASDSLAVASTAGAAQ